MQFLVPLFFFFLILSLDSSAQAKKTPVAIRFLLSTEKDIPVISGWFNGIIPKENLPEELGKQLQYFIKTKEGLFCGINGTGMLYRIADSAGFIHLKRTDETFYVGDRFWSSNFTYQNQIYSLAGYGFWEHNGLLRKYNVSSKDWSIIELNEERVTSSGYNFWLDTSKGKLFLKPEINLEAYKKKSQWDESDTSRLYALDLENGRWEPIGTLNGRLKSKVNTQWGILNFGPYSAVLYDFKGNNILYGKPALLDKLKKALAGSENNIHFCVDSTLYFTGPSFDVLDSILLSENDFENRNIRLYTPTNSNSYSFDNSALWWSLPLTLFGVVLVWMKQRIRKNLASGNNPASSLASDTNVSRDPRIIIADLKEVFTQNEQALIELLIRNMGAGNIVKTEDVNHLLGLSEKKESIQKKNRNDVINSINQKWTALEKGHTPLIMRKRADFDKRSYYYSIQLEQIERIKTIFE